VKQREKAGGPTHVVSAADAKKSGFAKPTADTKPTAAKTGMTADMKPKEEAKE